MAGSGLSTGGPASAMRDPVVPLDFGHWMRRVFGLFRRGWARLGVLAVVPVAISLVYALIVRHLVPDQAEIQRKVTEAAAASPTGTVSRGAVFWLAFGPWFGAVLVYLLVMLAVSGLYYGTGLHLTLREANGQPANLKDSLRLVAPRVPRFIGRLAVAALVAIVVVGFPLVIATITQVDWLSQVCSVAALVLLIWLGTNVYPTFVGVVFVEKAGLGRCFRLVRGRFWATLGRMVTAGLILFGYTVLTLLLSWLSSLPFGGMDEQGSAGSMVGFVVLLVLTIPEWVFLLAVSLVSFAELRFYQDPATSTRSLITEMNG
jgi:hypothetical protein